MPDSMSELRVKIDGSKFFEKHRRDEPVYFDEGYQAYVVTRHEDLMTVLREPILFSSAQAIFSSFNYEDVVTGVLETQGHGPLKKVLPMTDPPEHTRVRSLINLAFSVRRVDKIRDSIELLTNELIGKFEDSGRANIVAQLAEPLPVTVISDLLSVPRDRWRDVIRWTTAYSTCAGNQISSEEHAKNVGEDLAEMQNFIVDHLDKARERKTDDVLTDLLHAESADYEPLDEGEILAVAVAFIGAGHETSTVAITELVKVLAENPQFVAKLRNAQDQNAAVKNFCEEFLRMSPPLNAQPRIATAVTKIGGVDIPSGAMVLVVNASANRDEQVFGDSSESFCPARKNANRHVTFGGGVHICLGNMLARAELQCVTHTIINRLDDLRLVTPDVPESDYGPVIMDWNYHVKKLEVEFSKRTTDVE